MQTLYDLAKLFVAQNPFHDGAPWAWGRASFCGAAIYRFNGHTRGYATAHDGYLASTLVPAPIDRAPVGAFVHFSNNHVAQVVKAGPNPLLFMASNYLSSGNGHGLGFNTLAGYLVATRARVLGWSARYGVNDCREASDRGHVWRPVYDPELPRVRVRRIAGYLNRRRLGLPTRASATGRRGPRYWRLVQLAGKADGLYGRGYIVNGVPGRRTRQLERHYAAIA